MRDSRWQTLGRATLVLALSIVACAANGADFGLRPFDEEQASFEDLREYVEGRAVLHMTRAMFDVVDASSVPSLVEWDVRSVGASGPTATQVDQLTRELVSEASYALVSLRYLIEVGGAAWPEARPEAHYVADSLVILDGLLPIITGWLDEPADPLPVFQQLDQIYWWTEGQVSPSSSDTHFADRDRIVENALQKYAPQTQT